MVALSSSDFMTAPLYRTVGFLKFRCIFLDPLLKAAWANPAIGVIWRDAYTNCVGTAMLYHILSKYADFFRRVMLKSSFYSLFLTILLPTASCQAVKAAYICELKSQWNDADYFVDLPESTILQTFRQNKLTRNTNEILEGKNNTFTEAETPIIIDNDEEITRAEFNWTESANSEGKIYINAGSKFPIYMSSSHTSKTATVGDRIEARLAVDLKIGNRMFATQGSKINGHIATCKPARKLMQANLSRKRWMRAGGALGLQFDEIVTAEGEHLLLIAIPASQARIIENKAEGRVLGVNLEGEITPPLSAQLKAKSLQTSISLVGALGGPFSMPAMPIAFGVMGAISPSFAYMHPVGTNVRHRRLKGFAMGAVCGLPAGFLLSDSIIRAPECIIHPGDQFLVELKESMAIQTASDTIPVAQSQVYGQIVPNITKDTVPRICH